MINPSADFVTWAVEVVAAFVGWGVGLSVVFWTLGYLVWFIVQLFK